MDKVWFVEGFNEIPSKIQEYLERGWTVYNAPRPLLGQDTWVGEFRHGVFYAAVPLINGEEDASEVSSYHARNQELAGHECVIIKKGDVLEYGKRFAEEYQVNLEDVSYDELVRSYLFHVSSKKAVN